MCEFDPLYPITRNFVPCFDVLEFGDLFFRIYDLVYNSIRVLPTLQRNL